MNVLLIDDEPLARVELRALLLELHPACAFAEAADLDAAVHCIRTADPEIIFLDIELPGENGLDLFSHLSSPPPPVILTTAHENFALAAFEVGAADYLVKPVKLERLRTALDRAWRKESSVDTSEHQTILIRDGAESRLIRIDQILKLEAMGNYTKVHTAQCAPLAHRALKEFEVTLDPRRFFRASRGTLVNLDKIESFRNAPNGVLVAILSNGDAVEFSRRQSQAFRESRQF